MNDQNFETALLLVLLFGCALIFFGEWVFRDLAKPPSRSKILRLAKEDDEAEDGIGETSNKIFRILRWLIITIAIVATIVFHAK